LNSKNSLIRRRTNMAKRNREAMAEALKKRTQESTNRKSGGFITIFESDLENVTFWKCKEGDHTIDVIPYPVGPNDPHVKEGEPGYVLEVKVHQRVGAAEGSYLCLAENYNKPCPVCEHRKELKKTGADQDDIKLLYPKNRCVYNIVCYDTAEQEEKSIQIWEVSRWFSERYLTKLAKPKRRRGGGASEPINFASPVDGKTIEFSREGSGATNTQYIGHTFLDRDYEIDDDILDQAHCLDDLLHIPTYDELYEAYWGEETEGSDKTEDAPEQKQREPEPEKEEKKSSGRRSRRGGRKSKEEPPKEEKQETEACPGGGEFGIDIDSLDHCEDCEEWKSCAKANVKDQKEKEAPEKEPELEKEEKKSSGRRRRRR
jgi:hypothetical protein